MTHSILHCCMSSVCVMCIATVRCYLNQSCSTLQLIINHYVLTLVQCYTAFVTLMDHNQQQNCNPPPPLNIYPWGWGSSYSRIYLPSKWKITWFWKFSTNDDVVKNPRKLVELSPVIREWESGVSRRGHGQTRSMGQLSEDTPSMGVHSLLSCMMGEMWNIF